MTEYIVYAPTGDAGHYSELYVSGDDLTNDELREEARGAGFSGKVTVFNRTTVRHFDLDL